MARYLLENSLEGTGDATGEVGVRGPAVDDGALPLIELARVHINGRRADFDVFESNGVPSSGLGEGHPLEGSGVVGRFVAACGVGRTDGGEGGRRG